MTPHKDWESALETGQTLAMVIELGLLSHSQRQLLFTEYPIWPLLIQPEVETLRNEGPALIELTGQPFATQTQLEQRLVRDAQHGWLHSPMSIVNLRTHLGDALACRNIDGTPLLIRSYAHNVLPILYARHDQPWHAWLFGPVGHWWLPSQQGWRHLEGHAQSESPPYHPIALDDNLVDRLSIDQHAQALVTELQEHAPQVFTNDCHGDRLAQVSEALSQAREAGLSRQQDQYFFALYSLLSGAPLSQHPQWPLMLHRAEQQHESLADIKLELDPQA